MAEAGGSSSDESVDVTSPKFDPLKALYASKLKIPVAKAPLFDNIHKYEAHTRGIITHRGGQLTKPPKASLRDFSSNQKIYNADAIERNKNVLSKMQGVSGPLELLYNCMESRTRIKVYTRSARSVRGFIEAYVAAFDKHWNLALEDCYEVWQRKIKRKSTALDAVKKLETTHVDACKVIVKETNGNMETLERHVPQMLLRGEQIVIIAKIKVN